MDLAAFRLQADLACRHVTVSGLIDLLTVDYHSDRTTIDCDFSPIPVARLFLGGLGLADNKNPTKFLCSMSLN